MGKNCSHDVGGREATIAGKGLYLVRIEASHLSEKEAPRSIPASTTVAEEVEFRSRLRM